MSATDVARVLANRETFVLATMCPRLPGPSMSYGSFCQWSAARVGNVVFPILVLKRAL